jgi:subtilisin
MMRVVAASVAAALAVSSMASRARRGATVLVAAVGATALVGAAAPGAGAAPDPERLPGAWIVTLVEGALPDAVAAEHGRRYDASVAHVYRHALNGYAARMSEEAATRVAADSRVAAVEPDRVVGLAAQVLPTGIDRVEADISPRALAGNGSGTVNVDVAVIDTGIAAHPDLTISGGKNCSTGKSYADGHGHGTHVAGTIAAKDDTAGVVGVAPGARLWAVRVLNNAGSGTTSSVLCGVDWVTANAATIEVANMSLGGGGSDPKDGVVGDCTTGNAYHDAVCKSVGRGVTYVVAAGNSAADARTSVPAAFDEVITVSALADFNGKSGGGGAATCRTDVDDTFADFSNFGADVDLIAPGVCIRSTWLSGGFNTISGTSMASPHVAGAAALYKAADPSASPASVRQALRSAGGTDWSNADDKDSIKEPLLNVARF